MDAAKKVIHIHASQKEKVDGNIGKILLWKITIVQTVITGSLTERTATFTPKQH